MEKRNDNKERRRKDNGLQLREGLEPYQVKKPRCWRHTVKLIILCLGEGEKRGEGEERRRREGEEGGVDLSAKRRMR